METAQSWPGKRWDTDAGNGGIRMPETMGNGCEKILGIFRCVPADSRVVPVRNGGNRREKFREFPAGILLPSSCDFPCFTAGSRPYISTWVYTRRLFNTNVDIGCVCGCVDVGVDVGVGVGVGVGCGCSCGYGCGCGVWLWLWVWVSV